MPRLRRRPTFSEFTSALVVEQAYQEIVRLHHVDYNAAETFRKINLFPSEFAALRMKCHAQNLLLETRWDNNVRLDYVVNDGALYLRRMSPLQLDLAAKFSWELNCRIVTMGDREELRRLEPLARHCVTSFDQRKHTPSEGGRLIGQHDVFSFRDPDVHLHIQSPDQFYGSEVIIEITDPAKTHLCPKMPEGYVRCMEDPWLNRRNSTLYIGLNLDDDTPIASYTVMTGEWRRLAIAGGRWRLIPRFLHRETVFRDRNGKLVPGTLELKPQTILGRDLVREAFPARKSRVRAESTVAVAFSHEELFRYVEYAEKKLVNRLLPHIGIRELELQLPEFEGRRLEEDNK